MTESVPALSRKADTMFSVWEEEFAGWIVYCLLSRIVGILHCQTESISVGGGVVLRTQPAALDCETWLFCLNFGLLADLYHKMRLFECGLLRSILIAQLFSGANQKVERSSLLIPND